MVWVALILTFIRLLLGAIALLVYWVLWVFEKAFMRLAVWAWDKTFDHRIWYLLYIIAYWLNWLISWPSKLFRGISSILLPGNKKGGKGKTI